MSRFIAGALAAAAVAAPAVVVIGTTPANAGGVALVRVVDRFHNGRVEVKVNDDIDRKLSYGDRTRFREVTPAPSGNDIISVTWLKYPGCGVGDAMKYFRAGHRYRLVISADGGGRCGAKGANNAKSPGFRVVQLD